MLSRFWAMRVVGGLLLAGLFGSAAVVQAMYRAERSARPIELTVAEATRSAQSGARMDHVRLTDLVIDCGARQTENGKIYTGGRGQAEESIIIIELDPELACEDGPLLVAGRVQRFPMPRDYEPSEGEVPQLALFRPHTDGIAWLVGFAVLAVLGVVLVGSGLRRFRADRELLRRASDDPPVSVPEPRQEHDPYRNEQDRGRLLSGPLRPDEAWLLRARRGAIGGGVFAAVALVLGLLWAASITLSAIRTHSVWSSGALATDADVSGQGRAGGRGTLFTSADMVIVYSDADGGRHHGTYWRLALLSRIDEIFPPVVKYDREHPERFALSWVFKGLWGELALMLAMLLVVVPASLMTLRMPRRRLKELRDIRETLHSSPEEVVLHVLYAQQNEVKGEHISTLYGLRLPEGGTITELFASGERPLFLEIDESKILGLRRAGRPEQVVVLHEDLAPLVPDEHEAERVRLRYRKGTRAKT